MELSNRIIARAVDLWCVKLTNPTFDNGDNTPTGAFGSHLAEINIDMELKSEPQLAEKIEVFRKDLTVRVKADIKAGGRQYRYLDTDYAPNDLLSDSARIAGISGAFFSVKSSVSINPDSVCSSFGYQGERLYHYPLKDDRWLVTSLYGEDISKIIAQIEAGQDLGLTIEKGIS